MSANQSSYSGTGLFARSTRLAIRTLSDPNRLIDRRRTRASRASSTICSLRRQRQWYPPTERPSRQWLLNLPGGHIHPKRFRDRAPAVSVSWQQRRTPKSHRVPAGEPDQFRRATQYPAHALVHEFWGNIRPQVHNQLIDIPRRPVARMRVVRCGLVFFSIGEQGVLLRAIEPGIEEPSENEFIDTPRLGDHLIGLDCHPVKQSWSKVQNPRTKSIASKRAFEKGEPQELAHRRPRHADESNVELWWSPQTSERETLKAVPII